MSQLQNTVNEIVDILDKALELQKARGLGTQIGPFAMIGIGGVLAEADESPSLYLTEKQLAEDVLPSELLISLVLLERPDIMLPDDFRKASDRYKQIVGNAKKLLDNGGIIGGDGSVEHPYIRAL